VTSSAIFLFFSFISEIPFFISKISSEIFLLSFAQLVFRISQPYFYQQLAAMLANKRKQPYEIVSSCINYIFILVV